MANQGLVKPGHLVYDPFFGSGSIGIACNYLKARTFGSDLDIRILKGYGVGRKNPNFMKVES